MTDSPIFTWGDVEFLRREAARRERAATQKCDPESAGALRESARRFRSLAERIGQRLQRGEAA